MEEVKEAIESPTLPQTQTTQPPAQATQQPNLPIGWSYNNQKSFENVRKARAVANMKHGMYSGVPIVCQGAKCPFKDTCWIPENEREIGGRCPIEVGAILERFEAYVREWNVADDDTTDHSLLKDIIDIEIMMLRADNSLAISGDFIQEVVAGTDDQGRAIKRPELHKAFEAKARLRQERIKLLNQMNSTRKDKKQEVLGLTDPSSIAANLMKKMRALQDEGKIIDVTPTVEQDGVKEVETLPQPEEVKTDGN